MLPGWKATASIWIGGMGDSLYNFHTFNFTNFRFYYGVYLQTRILIICQQWGHTIHLLDQIKFSPLISCSMTVASGECDASIEAAIAAIAALRSAMSYSIMASFLSKVIWCVVDIIVE
jgi:hypothetical protein